MTIVTITGNTCSDGELRFTPAGKAVFNFSVAVNERRKDGDQWVDDGATFYDCSAWGEMAESCAESISQKGVRVIVTGRLRSRTFQNREGRDVMRLALDVEDVGPSLRWATATVQRSQRQGQSQRRQGDPWQPPSGRDPWQSDQQRGQQAQSDAPPF